MKTSIIILTYNNLDYTKQCIQSIKKYTADKSYELIVIDNHSTDGTVEWLKKQDGLITIYNKENMGFPGGCNQGIKVSTGDSVLLLNNDVIVTPKWLDNLTTCLFSSADIAAVGPVSNSAPYYQSIPVPYQNTSGIEAFAKKYNQSDPAKWEERLKLIGFCMLIKRKVIDEVGLLDEAYFPGNYEDDDYCMRMRRAGYRLVLCRDTFIHHFGGASFKKTDTYSSVMRNNERRFKDKWGFCSGENMDIFAEAAAMIDRDRDDVFNVVEIGCGCGGTLLHIKNKFPGARLYGIDKNGNALAECRKIAEIVTGDIETLNPDFEDNHFDYVIMADLLQQLKHTALALEKVKRWIKQDGRLIVSIPNVMNYYVLYNLLKGNTLYDNLSIRNVISERNLRVFNFVEISNLLNACGYENITGTKVLLDPEPGEERFIDSLCQMMGHELREQYLAKQYILSGRPKYSGNLREVDEYRGQEEFMENIKFILRRIENDIDTEESIANLLQQISSGEIDVNYILDIVMKDIVDKEKVLNTLGVKCYEHGLYDYVIPFLEKSYAINNENQDTLYNLVYVLSAFGENQMALDFAARIKEPDDELQNLIASIKGEAANG